MKAGRCHLCAVSLPCSRSLLSPQKELVYMYGVPIFVATAQGTPLDRLALVASKVYVYGSHKKVTEKEFLTTYTPGHSSREPADWNTFFLGKRPVSLSSQLQPEWQASNYKVSIDRYILIAISLFSVFVPRFISFCLTLPFWFDNFLSCYAWIPFFFSFVYLL